MTQTFSVRNFERFQHYKDRSPPWIKLYNELLDDYRFAVLPDASKWHLVAIWLLASRSDNEIPADTKWIAGHIGATEQVDLTPLQEAGFIVTGQSRSDAPASCAQSAMPERESETEGETEKEDSSGPADAIPPDPLKAKKKTYPAPFEEFWHAYPVDALMSKSKAFEKWGRLSLPDRAAALAACPGFRAHCAKDLTYRPVHAWNGNSLSQRRFDWVHRGRDADTGGGCGPARRMGRAGRCAGHHHRAGEIRRLVFRHRVRSRPAHGAARGQSLRGGLDHAPLRRRSQTAVRRYQGGGWRL